MYNSAQILTWEYEQKQYEQYLLQKSLLYNAKFNLMLALLLAVCIYSIMFKVALFQFKTWCVSELDSRRNEWWTMGCEHGAWCAEGCRDTGAPHDG